MYHRKRLVLTPVPLRTLQFKVHVLCKIDFLQRLGQLKRAGNGLSKLLCVRRSVDETPSCLKVEALKLAEEKEEDEDEERKAVSPEVEAGSEAKGNGKGVANTSGLAHLTSEKE